MTTRTCPIRSIQGCLALFLLLLPVATSAAEPESPRELPAGRIVGGAQSGQVPEGIDSHLGDFGKVVGRVEDRLSGAAIENAEIRYYEAATLNEGGQVDLPPFRLRALGKIRGKVVDAVDGEAISPFIVAAFAHPFGPASQSAAGDMDGNFEVSGLEPGTYYLLVDGPEGRDLLVGGPEACLASTIGGPGVLASCDPTQGQPFVVELGETLEVGELPLAEAARIRGSIRLEEERKERVYLELYSSSGRYLAIWIGPTVPENVYPFELSLPSGTYHLVAHAIEHLSQAFLGLNCTRGEIYCLSPEQSTPISVGAGDLREDIDFDLLLNRQPCEPSATRLCLGNGRFTVTNDIGLSSPFGGRPEGLTNPISNDAGYFTFFDPANVEVVVKVLDACRDYDSFWVFAAGLTDVDNSLKVRDNWAARTAHYDSIGPFLPLRDFTTFSTCSIPAPDTSPAPPPESLAQPLIEEPEIEEDEVPCGGDPATSLCLGNRFRVEVEWTTASGQSGSGMARTLTSDTGFFYFFSPNNIEVIVKALNGCSETLNHRYWLFAAGLTDVAVTLKVEDTRTGVEKVYLSSLGQAFQPILDIDAFATCP